MINLTQLQLKKVFFETLILAGRNGTIIKNCSNSWCFLTYNGGELCTCALIGSQNTENTDHSRTVHLCVSSVLLFPQFQSWRGSETKFRTVCWNHNEGSLFSNNIKKKKKYIQISSQLSRQMNFMMIHRESSIIIDIYKA